MVSKTTLIPFGLLLLGGMGVQFFLPWWSLAVFAFLIGLWLGNTLLSTALISFFAGGLCWLIPALAIHLFKGDRMTQHIAELFGLGHSLWMFAIVFFMAGLMAALSAVSGRMVGQLVCKQSGRKTVD